MLTVLRSLPNIKIFKARNQIEDRTKSRWSPRM